MTRRLRSRNEDAVLRVGLTGGIGAGKSAVARSLCAHGAVVVDADQLAREVVAPGTDGLAEVVAQFGPAVLDADGALDRGKLAAIVFADDAARARLNAVVHPRVAALFEQRAAEAADDAVLVHDVPLLVENGLAANYDLVIVVEAPLSARLQRLAGRGLSEAQARERIGAQADDEQRRAVADVVITNAGTLAQLRDQVAQVWRERIQPLRER